MDRTVSGRGCTEHPESNGQAPVPLGIIPFNCRLAALIARERGWFPVPLCPADCDGRHGGGKPHARDRSGKVPLLPGWSKPARLPTAKTVADWWERWPGANVGVVLGVKSGLVGIDIDPPDGEVLLAELSGGDLPPTLSFTTGSGGRRLLYRWPRGRPMPTRHIGTRHRPVSFLLDGSQTVIPPSEHHSGGLYVWDGGGDFPSGEPALAPRWLFAAVLRPAQERGLTGGWGGGPQPPAAEQEERERLALLYLEKCQPAEQGHGGDSQTYKVCCKLVGKFGLAPDRALSLLISQFNPRCSPPWSVRELERKVVLAAARHTEQRIDVAARRPAGPGAAPTTAARAEPADQPARPPAVPLTPAGGLVPERFTFLAHPYAARGLLTVLTGEPGVGKSTWAIWLAKHARRTLLLPSWGELVVSHFLGCLDAQGIDRGSVHVIDRGDYRLIRDRASMVRTVQESRADLLIIDPLASFLDLGLSENDNDQVRHFLETVQDIAGETGAAVLGLMHPGKAAGNYCRGAKNWVAVPRIVLDLSLEPGPEGRRILRPLQYNVGPPPPARYFDLIGGPDCFPRFAPGEPVDKAYLDALEENAQRDARTQLDLGCELLVQLLSPGEMEVPLILTRARAHGISEPTVRRAGRRLGLVRRQEGQGTGSRTYWALPGPGDTPAG